MKKKNQGWFPRGRAQQQVMFTNVKAKIAGYKNILPLAQDKIDRIILICDIFIAVFNYVEQTRATTLNLTDWQDLIFTGEGATKGEPAPAPPEFQELTLPAGAFVGIFEEFQELIADVKEADGYTRGIGEDLMIVAAEGEDISPEDLVADIKPQTLAGNKVRISGSLQGMKAMKVQYQAKGSNTVQEFFLTNLPAEITITATTPGQPENGFIRGVLIENNAPVGQWSPDFPVTIS
jgi:hypothetical protein